MQAIIFDLDHTLFKTDVSLHDGASDLLLILQNLGLKIGGFSGKDHRVLVRMEEAGIREYFSSVLCSSHVDDPKALHGIWRVLAELGALPHEALLVSHSHADILLGKDAGLARTIGVSHGSQNAPLLLDAGADHIVHDIPAVLDVLQ